MTSKLIDSVSKAKSIPIRKDITTENNKIVGSENLRRDLTLLSAPYDLTVLRTIGETSDILNQCIEAYAQNVAGFGFELKYNEDDREESAEMKSEWDALDSILHDLSLDRPAKEIIAECVRQTEETGNGYLEVIRNGSGDVVGINNLDAEYMTATKINRVTDSGGNTRRVRYFVFRDTLDDSGRVNGTWFKMFDDPTPLNVNGSIAEDGNAGTATELIQFKIGDYNKPYGVPRYIGALIKILGNRKADELNYSYFTQGRHMPLAIVLENAQLTAQSEATLQQYANDVSSQSAQQHKFLLVEAEKVGSEESMLGDDDKTKPAVHFEHLADVLQKDALFLEYNDNAVKRVLSAFRLPPVYVGLSSDYNRATVETAKQLTEEQVFQPLRESYGWQINNILKDYEFKHVHMRLKTPDIQNTEDIAAILTPAVNAGAVAPNDLRDILSKVLNKHLENFDGDQYNLPLNSAYPSAVDVTKAYGGEPDGELSGMIRRLLRKAAK